MRMLHKSNYIVKMGYIPDWECYTLYCSIHLNLIKMQIPLGRTYKLHIVLVRFV